MSTTFAVKTKGGELKDVARRGGGINMVWLDPMAEMLPDDTSVEAVDNTRQGIFTIGDIKDAMYREPEEKEPEEKGLEEKELEDESWIYDKSKIEKYERKSVFVPLIDAWHKEHDFIEVTEWKSGEGWDIEIYTDSGPRHLSLHFTEFAVIKELIELLGN